MGSTLFLTHSSHPCSLRTSEVLLPNPLSIDSITLDTVTPEKMEEETGRTKDAKRTAGVASGCLQCSYTDVYRSVALHCACNIQRM